MMRRLGFVFLFLFAAAAWGQADTTVVGKAVTSKGVLYARGSVTAVLVDTRGNEISSTRQRAATMDADGNFSIPLVAQRRWKLTLCASRPAAGGCFTVTVTVGSNSPQDISRALVQAALGAGPAVTSTSTTSTDTTVIGNAIISSNGVLYAHGSVTATLVDSSGNDLSSSPVLIGGVPVTIPQRQTNLDSGANFAIPLVPRATISQPNNTNWKLNICSQNPAGNPPGVPPMVCFIYTVTVGTTSPQDISSTLNAIPPPPIQGGGGGGGGVCGGAGAAGAGVWRAS